MAINVIACNLKPRKERLGSLINEFKKTKVLQLQVVNSISNNNGALGLWYTIQQIVKSRININEDFFIFCEDDHQFTAFYDFNYLEDSIREAIELKADILCGGISWFKTAIQVRDNLFWVDKFSGLQFTIIFKQMYSKITEVKDFGLNDAADYKISELAETKLVMHPFISTQKDFGYSDVTSVNNENGRVERLFVETSERLDILKDVKNYYFSSKLNR